MFDHQITIKLWEIQKKLRKRYNIITLWAIFEFFINCIKEIKKAPIVISNIFDVYF
jgi:hypothetical protein